jgi:uncharacterized protein YeeX (DUF496 family)
MQINQLSENVKSYLEVSLQIKELELIKASLANQIQDFLTENDLKSYDCSQHRITRCFRRKYRYSPEIQALENELRDAKKHFETQCPDYELITYISAKSLKITQIGET